MKILGSEDVKIHQIAGEGFDSNVYLIDDEMLTLVDAGTGLFSDAAKERMKKLGFSPAEIDLLVNTHCHFDHAGGDPDFVGPSSCEVAIHESEAGVLEKGDATISCSSMFGEPFRPVKVSHTLRDGNTLDLGKIILEVLHTPGHTAGSVCLYDRKNRVLFSGDTVFCGGVGRTDLPTGDAAALRQSLERLKSLPVEKLYPGHGPFAETEGEKFIFAAIDFMKEWGEP